MPAPRTIEFDLSHRPLVFVRYHGRAMTSEMQEVFDQRTRWMQGGERHVLIHDMRRASITCTADQRRLQTDWMKQNRMLMRETMLGVAFVTDSAALRLLLSIVAHMNPLPMPHVYLSRMSEAITWSAEQLRQARMTGEAQRILAHFESGRDLRMA